MTEQKAPAKRGRKTKDAEARDYLRKEFGIDPDELMGAPDDEPMPETATEYLEEFKKLIWKRRHSLNDTAFTQLLNAFARLAAASSDDGDRDDDPLVADVVSGIALLSAGRKREILQRALAELDAERARIVEVLDAEGSADR